MVFPRAWRLSEDSGLLLGTYRTWLLVGTWWTWLEAWSLAWPRYKGSCWEMRLEVLLRPEGKRPLSRLWGFGSQANISVHISHLGNLLEAFPGPFLGNAWIWAGTEEPAFGKRHQPLCLTSIDGVTVKPSSASLMEFKRGSPSAGRLALTTG